MPTAGDDRGHASTTNEAPPRKWMSLDRFIAVTFIAQLVGASLLFVGLLLGAGPGALMMLVPSLLTYLARRTRRAWTRLALLVTTFAMEIGLVVLTREIYLVPLNLALDPLPTSIGWRVAGEISWAVWHVVPWLLAAALAWHITTMVRARRAAAPRESGGA